MQKRMGLESLLKSFIFLLLGFTCSAQDFQELSSELNIDHITRDEHGMAGGVSLLDYNNDGWLDIYFTGGQAPDHLYRNTGDGAFVDVSEEMGISALADRYTMGVVAGDLDNDGYTDLFITTFREEGDICLRNVPSAGFVDVSEEAGFTGDYWTASSTLGDYDGDGDLDIYVSNYVDFFEKPFFLNLLTSRPNALYENLGNWNFMRNDSMLVNGHEGCTLATAFTDVNRDMRPDLFVVNDFGNTYGANEMYLNVEEELVEVGGSTGANVAMNGMGIAIGDFDEDGYFDYYLTNIRNNYLLQNTSQSILNNVSENYNVNDGLPNYAWGTFFADLNNDSNLDLFVGKGSVQEADDPQENKLYEFYPITSNFADVTNLKGLNHPGKTRGAAYGDLNKDGKLDIVCNNVRIGMMNLDRPLLYMNEGIGGDYLSLELEGVESNRSAIGARVELYTDEKMMMRELTGGSSYLSNHTDMLHFGIGGGVMDSMKVYWPSGMIQNFSGLMKNTAYSLLEGGELEFEGRQDTMTSGLLELMPPVLISAFPNPAGDFVTLSSSELDLSSAEIMVYDVSGRRATLTYIMSGNSLIVNTQEMSDGLYFVKVITDDEQHVVKIQVMRSS